MRSLDIAATGLQAQQRNIDVISNNLANATTSAFKAQRAGFQDLIYQNIKRTGANSSDVGTLIPTGIELGLGVKNGAIYRNHNIGTLQQTNNTFDLAISGKGYFTVTQPNGELAYTRDGTFQLNEQGILVNLNGFELQPAITIPNNAETITINESGQVIASFSDQSATQNLGQINLVYFINENGLSAIGGNLFVETEASGAPINGIADQENFGSILQGFLENSNVDPITELTQLIVAQRTYEFNTRVITKTDQMMQSLNQSV